MATSPNAPQWGQGDSIVEIREIPGALRSAGGAHTTPRATTMRRDALPLDVCRNPIRSSHSQPRGARPVDVVGEDGKIYHGRMRSSGPVRPSTGKQ